MITVKEAQKKIISNKIFLNNETIKLNNSLGRVTCDNIKSKLNHPSNNLSSMDGYALRYNDAILIKTAPVTIVGESSAGNPFRRSIKKQECIRISTGAVIPEGLNCILLKEFSLPILVCWMYALTASSIVFYSMIFHPNNGYSTRMYLASSVSSQTKF